MKIVSNIITTVFEFFCGLVITVSLFFLYDSLTIEKQAEADIYTDLKPSVEENLSLEDLQAINPDVVGWLTIDNTNIDYPVLQNTDEYSYLNRDVYGNTSLTGSLYIDKNASWDDDYIVIYGHHMSGGLMFGGLDYFLDTDYFDSHQTGTLITNDKIYSITPIRVEEIDAYDRIYLYGDYEILVEKYDDLEEGKYLILSTCRGEGTDRLILIALLEEI